ncbi:MAG: hypothetical protein ACTSPW_00790 [Promethearchaeota archaeon]
MPFVELGHKKFSVIGPCPMYGGFNALEVVLRESGRYIMKGDDAFIALSQKKTREINISGSVSSNQDAQWIVQYDENPQQIEFNSADMFPQDLQNDYRDIKELDVYGLLALCDMSLTSKPSDAETYMKSTKSIIWITRQPTTSFANEDGVSVQFFAYCSMPLLSQGEGVTTTTTKKHLIPIFTPIRMNEGVRKGIDKIYVYNDTMILIYCENSTAGGNINGSVNLEYRLILGMGYLQEEVEELITATQ